MKTKVIALSKLCKIQGRVGWKGYTVDDLRDSGPLVIGANDIDTNHQLDLKEVKHISREKFEESPEIMIEKHDILIVKVGSTIGKVAIVNEDIGEACINPNTVLLKNCTINPYFIYYTLVSSYGQNFLLNNSSASAQPALNQTTLKEMPIYVPEDALSIDILTETLNRINSKIKLNNKINRELEAMAKTLYDYWFVQFDFPNSEGKPYKSSGGKMVYTAELKREIPEGWEVKTLLDIATYTNGLACQKFRPTNDEFLPVIKIREMRDGFTEGTEKVKADIPEKLIVNNGDVLFSWSASLEVMIWTGGKGGLNQHIFKVTSKKYPRSFYYFQLIWYLQHFKMIAELRKTTMGHITQDHLKQSRIVVPPIEIIRQLDRQLKPIQEKQILINQQNQHLTALRDWLLPMLMNGQVRVREVEEQLGMVAEDGVKYGL